MAENRLGAGRFLQTLHFAGHLSATFLIVATKCSLDTRFKRIARRTHGTRHARRCWMVSNISAGLHMLYAESDLSIWPFVVSVSPTSELNAYETVTNRNSDSYVQLLMCQSIISLRVLSLWLSYASEEKHLPSQKPPGSWHSISQLQKESQVNLFLQAFPPSPSLTPPWIDDAWPNSAESRSSCYTA